uniref:Uncharacterized protein n=1 Tax=Arion vulgaris TaxID=1028688 RepID=A0A0B7ASC9_9EUPU
MTLTSSCFLIFNFSINFTSDVGEGSPHGKGHQSNGKQASRKNQSEVPYQAP